MASEGSKTYKSVYYTYIDLSKPRSRVASSNEAEPSRDCSHVRAEDTQAVGSQTQVLGRVYGLCNVGAGTWVVSCWADWNGLQIGLKQVVKLQIVAFGCSGARKQRGNVDPKHLSRLLIHN